MNVAVWLVGIIGCGPVYRAHPYHYQDENLSCRNGRCISVSFSEQVGFCYNGLAVPNALRADCSFPLYISQHTCVPALLYLLLLLLWPSVSCFALFSPRVEKNRAVHHIASEAAAVAFPFVCSWPKLLRGRPFRGNEHWQGETCMENCHCFDYCHTGYCVYSSSLSLMHECTVEPPLLTVNNSMSPYRTATTSNNVSL